MIFVGNGSLLRRAVDFALAAGHRVDLVISDDPADGAATVPVAPYLYTTDVNVHADRLAAQCTDGIVWSINNRMIFRAPVLDSGLRVYNVHNGLLPQHRGLSSVAVLFALLHGHTEYGVTLHKVDRGIDTGRVLAERRFPIGPDARYHEVLLRGVQNCHRIFESNLQTVAGGECLRSVTPGAAADSAAEHGYYGLRALSELGRYICHPAFARATDLGVVAPFVPEVDAALARALKNKPSRCSR
ncbi:formyltransferase family protein [Streptomyces sp. NPDC002730]|uniref:formyltransferase family protein n=1 Tax=Streptomyces sp. NPDC002730 TaxID=3364662 RepID=UPI0036BBBA3A